jgi:hypothetical protein
MALRAPRTAPCAQRPMETDDEPDAPPLLRRHCCAATLALPFAAYAQGRFPANPIPLICPWPPGGSSAAVVPAFGDSASRALRVPVRVENKPAPAARWAPARCWRPRPTATR